MSESRTITLTLDAKVLREAQILAADRGLSVSAFLARELTELLERQRGYARARKSALRRLSRGQTLGGGKLRSRDELMRR
jgi:hypothetical protein